MENKKLVIMPAYNESKNIAHVIEDIKTHLPELDILIINDKSTDNTLEILENTEGITYLKHPVNMGYFKTIQTGFKYANQHKYDAALLFDSDGQHLASEARKLVDKFDNSDVDIVIGSRFIEDFGYNHRFLKRIGTGIFQKLVKVCTKQNLTDPTSGLKVFGKDAIAYLSSDKNFKDYLDANLLLDLHYNNFKMVEVPVKMKEAEDGGMYPGIIGPGLYMAKIFALIGVSSITNVVKKLKNG